MPFEPAPFEDLVPVKAGEVIGPMRVVWRGANGLVTTRVLPTAERAYTFAAERPGAYVQGVDESPPRNDLGRRRRGIRTLASRGSTQS